MIMKDKPYVSNDYFELKHVAKKLGCMPSDVLRAKETLGTSNRKKIEEWLEHMIAFNKAPKKRKVNNNPEF